MKRLQLHMPNISNWIFTLFILVFFISAQAQDGVGINTTTIDPHAILDIQNPSGTKGVKFPIAPHDDIASLQDPSAGILIFDRNANQIFNSIKYTDLSGSEVKEFDAIGWGMRGNTYLDSSKHYLGTKNNNSFIISANGLGNGGGNMVISPDGKIGINMDVFPLTTRPRAALDVNGSIIIGTDYNVEEPGALQYDSNDDIMLYFSQQGQWVQLGSGGGGGSDNDWTIASGRVYNLTDNVGIGTASPSNKIGIAGGAAIGSSYASSASAPTNGLTVEGNIGIGTAGSNNYQLNLSTSSSGSNSSGIYNVQAGAHSSSGYGIYNVNNMNTNSSKYGLYNLLNSTGTGLKYGISNYVYGNLFSTNDVYGMYNYVTGSGTGKFYGMRLSNNANGSGSDYGVYSTGEDYNYFEGSIGIGTTTPSSKIHIIDESTSSYIAHFNNTTTGGGTGIFTEVTTSPSNSGNRYGINARAWFGQSTNYGGYFYGYGGSTAYGVYAVAGGSSSTSYAGYFNGSVFTTDSYIGSDRELKNDIKGYENALDLLDQITIHSYSYKQDGDFKKMNLPKGAQVGFMADNMEQIFPSLVKKTEFDFNQFDDQMKPVDNADPNIFEFDAVNYVGMVPVLAKAIQEQQELIEAQQAQIEELKKEMDELKRN